jgi:hypothetical protein
LADNEMAVGEICVVEEDESESRKKWCAGTEIEAAMAMERPVTALNSPDVGAVLHMRLLLSACWPDGLHGASLDTSPAAAGGPGCRHSSYLHVVVVVRNSWSSIKQQATSTSGRTG